MKVMGISIKLLKKTISTASSSIFAHFKTGYIIPITKAVFVEKRTDFTYIKRKRLLKNQLMNE